MKALALTILAVVSGIPILAGVGITLAEATDPGAWSAVFHFPGLGRSLALSVWTGAAGTILALLLAHLTLALAGTTVWARRVEALALPVIAMPHLALGIGLALLLSPSGLLLRLLSPWASGLHRPPDWLIVQDPLGLSLVLGLAVKEAPFLILMLVGARAQVPVTRLMLQSRSLGYGRLKSWWVSVAPLLQRQIRLPLAAAFVFGMTNVEMAIPLGPVTPPPFAVVLWQWFTASRLELRGAAFAGAVLLTVVAIGALVVALGALRLARRVHSRYAASGRRGRRSASSTRVLAILPGVVLGLASGALVALACRGLSPMWRFPAVLPGEIDMGLIGRSAPALGTALGTTLALGGITIALAVGLSLWVAECLSRDGSWRRRVGVLLFVPLLLPQMAFLFGFQWLVVRLRIDGTWWAVGWEHALFALPYAWGIVSGARSALDSRLVVTARMLGAGPLRAWWAVVLPLLARSILLAGAIAFSISVALYLPTLFAGAGRVATVATEAASAASSGNLRVAAVHGAAQAIAPLLALGAAMLIGQLLFRNRQGVPR